ncbi:ATP-binding cassette sub-family B member 5 [Daphnia magna]|uniref:ABC-type xenobiotic transporter n=1 Tax=Daphnia magna TaxID=35525 RepID=A0A162C9G9_9CRUS|nr:ATP-binding cassette sub-family B member 5 [Daphnia magna]
MTWNRFAPNEIRPKIKSQTMEDRAVPYILLFRFASTSDVWLTIVSIVSAVSAGISLPVLIILFGKLTDSFARGESSACSYTYNGNGCDTARISNRTQFGKLLPENQMKRYPLMEDVITYCIESATVGVASLILHAVFVACLNVAAYNQGRRIRSLLFEAVLFQEIAWHDIRHPQDFVAQSTDNVRKIEESIGEKLGLIIYYSSAFAACTITALYHGWRLTMVILSPLPLLTATTFFLSKQKTKFMLQELCANSLATASVEEVFECLRTVVAFGGQQKELQRFQQEMQTTEFATFRRSLLSGLEAGLWWLLTFVSYALAFWYGVGMVLSSSSSLSDNKSIQGEQKYSVATFNIVFFNVLYGGTKISQLLNLIEIFYTGKVAANSVFKTIDTLRITQLSKKRESHNSPGKIEGLIEFDEVQFSYPSRLEVSVLKGISFNIPLGKTVALVGPSGCGKTTVIQIIQRLYDPIQGVIRLDGIPLNEYDPIWLRRHIGIVGQEPVLFAATIRENILLGGCFNGNEQQEILMVEMQHAARQALAHDFIRSLPLGYETVIGEGGTQLSGGQKQCIAIARALMKDPKILLLDEPTSALDTLSEVAVQKALDSVCRGRTCVIIAHRMATIRKADLIIVLHEGLIAESGSHETLMAKGGLYFNLVTKSNSAHSQTCSPIAEPSSKIRPIQSNNSVISALENQPPSVNGVKAQSNRSMPRHMHHGEICSQKKYSTLLTKVVGLNRQLLPYVALGVLGSIITGLCQPIFSIVFGETLSLLSMGTRADTEINEIRVKFLFAFLVLAVVAGIAGFVQTFTFSLAGSRLLLQLRILSYQSILNQEISWFDRPENSVGALCTRLMSDPFNIQSVVGLRMGAVIQGLSSLVFSLGLAFYYQWKLALVGFIFIPMLLIIFVIDSKLGWTQNSAEEKKCIEDSNRVATETISNIRTVVGLNKQEHFYENYKEILEMGQQPLRMRAAVRGLVCALASNLDTLVSIFFYVLWGKAFDSAGRFCSLLDTGVDSSDTSSDHKPTAYIPHARLLEQIKFENVRFSYPVRADVPVLDEFNVVIQPGQRVALVGPNGSGKSTCIQLLQRFYDPDRGSIHLNGCSLVDFSKKSLRFRFGLVCQEPILFNRTIGENIAYGDNTRQALTEELIESARQANIHHWIESLPNGYETIVGHRGAQLSGGQKQRVAIARALLRRPQILILDEAMSALDSESELLVQQALNRAQVGRTCIVISHSLQSISNANLILVLNRGRIEEQGNHQQLMELGGLYHKLFTSEKSC